MDEKQFKELMKQLKQIEGRVQEQIAFIVELNKNIDEIKPDMAEIAGSFRRNR